MSMADITPAAGGASAPTYIPLPRYTDDLIVVVRGDGTYEVNSRSRRGLMHHVDPVRRLCTCRAFDFHGACPHLVEIDEWLAGRREARCVQYGSTSAQVELLCPCRRGVLVTREDPELGSACAECWADYYVRGELCREPGCGRPRQPGSAYCRGHQLMEAFVG